MVDELDAAPAVVDEPVAQEVHLHDRPGVGVEAELDPVLGVKATWTIAGTRGAGAKSSGQERLEKRRAQLFAELTTLEEQYRAGRVAPERYAVRRAELVTALERVYAELDRLAA